MDTPVLIRKAYYLCGCSREFITEDVPKNCPCHLDEAGLPLTRIETFRALREIVNGVPVYPEASVGSGHRDSGMAGWSGWNK